MKVETEKTEIILLPLRIFTDIDAEMTGTTEIKTLSLAYTSSYRKGLQKMRPLKNFALKGPVSLLVLLIRRTF